MYANLPSNADRDSTPTSSMDPISKPIVKEFNVNINDEMEEDAEEDEENDVEEIPAPSNTNETIRDLVPPTGPFKRARQYEIFTISMDNATANDSCIEILKDTFSSVKESETISVVVTKGYKSLPNLFNNSISHIEDWFSDVRLDGTLTYEMLACAIKFKEVFPRLALEDREYVYRPSVDD
uniref:Uncharacterized protein n=1 Tax=Chenopodium quinoa TaxID=63459 RepID=A0A803LXQ4_CHEQI